MDMKRRTHETCCETYHKCLDASVLQGLKEINNRVAILHPRLADDDDLV